jgi:lipopolysaccharide transport system ATP-binding protein
VSVNVEPDILVVDEALSVGDIVFQFRCVERMNRLMEAGTTLLFVSHDLTMVKAFCRRAIYLEAGRTKMIAAAEEVAEAYIADSRDAQRRGIAPRAAAAAGAAGAGRVLGARFSATSGERSTFVYGDEIEFEAEVQAPPGLARPTVSAMIQDRRLLTVAGTVCPIAVGEGGARRVRVRFAARAVFAAGHYFITLRLENRLGDGSFLELDKQVGILSFEVMRSARQAFLGLVDISMTGREMK